MDKFFHRETEITDIDGRRCEVELATPIDGVVRLLIVDGDGDATSLEMERESMKALIIWLSEGWLTE